MTYPIFQLKYYEVFIFYCMKLSTFAPGFIKIPFFVFIQKGNLLISKAKISKILLCYVDLKQMQVLLNLQFLRFFQIQHLTISDTCARQKPQAIKSDTVISIHQSSMSPCLYMDVPTPDPSLCSTQFFPEVSESPSGIVVTSDFVHKEFVCTKLGTPT